MMNWQRLGIDKKEDVIKYLLGCLHNKREQILDRGLGGSWTFGKHKHGEIPELREATFVIGNRTFFLTDKGFINDSEVR